MRTFFPFISALCFFLSCTPAKKEHSKEIEPYFDIEGYFGAEVKRLSQQNPTIIKEVSIQSQTEKKSTKVNDWETELAGFINADINKSSWIGAFVKTETPHLVSYQTAEEKIPVKKIEISKIEGGIVSIKIFKETKNYLYQSVDTLIYYPDSLYQIKNVQKITFSAPKQYTITGHFP